jgi:hypothetical protein
MLNNEKEKLIKKYIEAYNAKDVDAMLKCIHEDVVFKNVTQGVVMIEVFGKTSLQELANQTKALFETRTQTVKSITHNEGMTRVDIHFDAVFGLDLPNGIKKGEAMSLEGYSEFEFKDGLLSLIADCS